MIRFHSVWYLSCILHELLECLLASNVLKVLLPVGKHSVDVCLVLYGQPQCSAVEKKK